MLTDWINENIYAIREYEQKIWRQVAANSPEVTERELTVAYAAVLDWLFQKATLEAAQKQIERLTALAVEKAGFFDDLEYSSNSAKNALRMLVDYVTENIGYFHRLIEADGRKAVITPKSGAKSMGVIDFINQEVYFRKKYFQKWLTVYKPCGIANARHFLLMLKKTNIKFNDSRNDSEYQTIIRIDPIEDRAYVFKNIIIEQPER
jgi:hypothetical protein